MSQCERAAMPGVRRTGGFEAPQLRRLPFRVWRVGPTKRRAKHSFARSFGVSTLRWAIDLCQRQKPEKRERALVRGMLDRPEAKNSISMRMKTKVLHIAGDHVP
jgi:hypothetical protein